MSMPISVKARDGPLFAARDLLVAVLTAATNHRVGPMVEAAKHKATPPTRADTKH